MMSSLGKEEVTPLSEVRVILIGSRRSGKSSSGNTILTKERFEWGRTRTTQCELRNGEVEGRRLVVVDTPGWSSSLSLTEMSEVETQGFKLNTSKCPPGPHAILLVIPTDLSFTTEQRRPLVERMKLLGEKAWKNTMVLFTCGDYLGEKTIEQHIESEGEALQWLVERCGNRYHVFNNKDRSSASQVLLLLGKIDEMVWDNKGSCYEADEHTLSIIREKQREATIRAKERQRKAEEQRQQLKELTPDSEVPNELRIVLLGSRNVGKSALGNTILEIKGQEDGKRTAHSVIHHGHVDSTAIVLVDTPGWWKGCSVNDTPELIKQEVISSMFLCRPGPHVFLLVIDADASFNNNHRKAVKGHLELLGEDVWRHTMVVFTRGDWLGKKTIEEHIELEGQALQALVDKCGNRYHVIDNKNKNDSTQVTEMLKKIKEMITGNSGSHFVPDESIFQTIEEKRKRVEEGAKRRLIQVQTRKKQFERSRSQLQEMRIVILGGKSAGKSAAGNTILQSKAFTSVANEYCEMKTGLVGDRQITVVDTPGWWRDPKWCTEDRDNEMARAMSLCSPGAHAVLLVIPADVTFTDQHRRALEEHVGLFDESIWKHCLILFTFGDILGDKAIEDHIEREKSSLQWLVEKCENRYHLLNKKKDATQVTELFEKIEEMVAVNGRQLFSPDFDNTHLRIDEKFKGKEIKAILKHCLEEQYRTRELQLMNGFKETLIELQAEIRDLHTEKATKQKLPFGEPKIKVLGMSHVTKDLRMKEQRIQLKIEEEIKKLDQDIFRSTELLRKSTEFLPPSMGGESLVSSVTGSPLNTRRQSSGFDKVLTWMASLHIKTTVENELTLDFSQTSSGYNSLSPTLFRPSRGSTSHECTEDYCVH